jgi:hypothetical protein
MATINRAVSASQEQFRLTQSRRSRTLPYDALNSRCPMCRAVPGRRCVSSHGKAIRYPHRKRIEAAAAEYRSEIRREILDRTRRHPFAQPFSPRRLADAGCFVARIPNREAGERTLGNAEVLTGPGLKDGSA